MKVEVLQYPIAWEDPTASFALISKELEAAEVAPGSLLVLPEMFATGFSLNVGRVVEDCDGPSALFLKKLATTYKSAVMGSFPYRSFGAGHALNRLLTFGPQGDELVSYDKIHPFSYGQEADFYKGGLHLRLFDFEGWRICPTVCYDLRFPELYRRATLEGGAELLVVVANWPAARREHWKALLKARAIENQAVVVGVNRIGADPNAQYAGDSMVIDAKGQVLLDAKDKAGRFTVELERESLLDWRKSFPALRDATSVFELDLSRVLSKS